MSEEERALLILIAEIVVELFKTDQAKIVLNREPLFVSSKRKRQSVEQYNQAIAPAEQRLAEAISAILEKRNTKPMKRRSTNQNSRRCSIENFNQKGKRHE